MSGIAWGSVRGIPAHPASLSARITGKITSTDNSDNTDIIDNTVTAGSHNIYFGGISNCSWELSRKEMCCYSQVAQNFWPPALGVLSRGKEPAS